MLVSSEVVPAHFLRAKELLMQLEGGMSFFLAAIGVEHLVLYRTAVVTNEAVDLVRLGSQCLASVEKCNAPRAYELFLKKRAERHQWRIVKDDNKARATVRLCCLAGDEKTEAWNEMTKLVDGLSAHEQEVLSAEIGRKDGITESPVHVPFGAGMLMAQAATNPRLSIASVVRLIIRILEDVARCQVPNHRMVKVHMTSFAQLAREYRGDGTQFEDTPFTLEEFAPGEVFVRIAGS